MKTKEKLQTMDGTDRCELRCKIADVIDSAFMQKISWDYAKDLLSELYHQFDRKISKADFNAAVESVLESTIDCYRQLIDDFEGAEDVIKV